MDGAVLTEIILIFILLGINGLFAMSEIAVVSARKAQLQQRAEEGDPSARVALELANSPERFLSTVQIGITLVGILAGAFGGATIAGSLAEVLAPLPGVGPYSEPLSFGLVVIAITYFSLVIGELVPKRIALAQPATIAARVAPFMQRLARVAAPAVTLLSGSTTLVLRLMRVRASEAPPVSEEELLLLLRQGAQAGVFVDEEQAIMARALELDDVRVSRLMTPRREVAWLDLTAPADTIRHTLLTCPHTYLLVGRGSLQALEGIVRVQAVLQQYLVHDEWDVAACLHHPHTAPESMRALALLDRFRASGIHVAVIFDEFGTVQGIVTLTDVLEVLVGELPDAGARAEPEVVRREDGSLLVDGLLSIRELKALLGVDALPEESLYDTLGGFTLWQLGRIPGASDHFTWQGWRFEVVDMDGSRVDKVLIVPGTG